MKHFRKVSAVLLAALMLAVMLPSFLVINAPSTEAADVGAVTNGTFETGDFTGWEYYSYGVSISSSNVQGGSYSARFGKDSSVANHDSLKQVIPVNTNATYSLTFYVKGGKSGCTNTPCFTYAVDLGTTSSEFTTTVKSGTPTTGTSYQKNTVSFSTSTYKYARIRFISLGTGDEDSYLDTVAMTATDSGDTGTHAAPSLTSFGTRLNRPSSDSNNLVTQPGFESTTNAEWNTDTFITGPVSHVTGDAEGAHSGSGYLKYYRGTVALTTWPEFTVSVPSAGEYVFSAWVRTPNLSATNVGKASIGIIDVDTGKFLTYGTNDDYYGHYSTPEIQIRSTATDDDWHLRSVTFYVGTGPANIRIGMYGLNSTMYVDDISVHLLTNGVEYTGDQHGSLSVSSTSVTNKYCESETNLIADCNMNGEDSVNFWTKAASGWNNGFLEFSKDAQHTENGNVLHYKGANPGSSKLYNYIKWVYVEPNTSYTVSFDYRVVSAGNQLMFADNNIRSPQIFHTPSLGSASNSWSTYAFSFSTGNYNRIAIVFRDSASAEAYFDDFRFFKTSDGISEEPEEEVFPTLKHTGGEKSRMEMTENNLLGLAFRFNLACTGVTVSEQHIGDYTNGKVQAFEDGVDYTLIKAGAVMTNQESVGTDADAFTLDNVASDNTVIDVNAAKLFNDYHKEYYDIQEEGITYAVRIINIPESHKDTVIYARPYYVFDYNGREITVYGDIVSDSYQPKKDVNDGWLEWG